MEFTFEENELSVRLIDKFIHSYRAQKYGEFPTRILTSINTAMKLIDENRFSVAMNIQPPYKIFGIKIVRCLDVEDNIIELH